MQRNFGIAIGAGVGIAIIIAVIALTADQNTEISEIEKPIEIDLEGDTTEIPEIQEALDELEQKASENSYKPAPREWITSGPFQIDRSKYVIGEKIFMRINDLDINDKGQIVLLRPLNDTHYSVYQTIPFDGMKKNTFNYYTEPRLSAIQEICSVEDIIGNWAVVFQGTNYPDIRFEVTDQILPGEEDSFVPVC